MAWTIKIKEVSYPSRTAVRIAFMLFKDGVAHVPDEVTLMPLELEQAEDKEQFILDKISEKAKTYISTDSIVAGVDEMKDKEYSIDEKADIAIVSTGAVVAKEAAISEAVEKIAG